MPQHGPILAYHLILSCYGHWLPNDPRGSGSVEVWAQALKPFGPATGIDSRDSVAHEPHDESSRLAAKDALKHSAVRLSGMQALHVAKGFERVMKRDKVACYALAILPDHMHLVVAMEGLAIQDLARRLKASAVSVLNHDDMHPFRLIDKPLRPKLFSRSFRKVYLYHRDAIEGAVEYVENNPIEAGLPQQKWSFVEKADAR